MSADLEKCSRSTAVIGAVTMFAAVGITASEQGREQVCLQHLLSWQGEGAAEGTPPPRTVPVPPGKGVGRCHKGPEPPGARRDPMTPLRGPPGDRAPEGQG